jgi:integrase
MSTAVALNVIQMPKRKAPPRRLRSDRTFLTREELARLMAAAKAHGPRTHAMVLLGFRHGLRVSEICRLRLVDDPEMKDSFLDTTSNTLVIRRLKGSAKTVRRLL